MNILISCEESQRVCSEFRKLGHNAFSCDIIPCSGGHDEWHIRQDVTDLLNGYCAFVTCDGDIHYDVWTKKWDMIIAFPPCTHLAVSGARHFEQKRADGRQREAIEFFCKFFNADCDRVAIENPIGIISGDYIKRWFPDIARREGLPLKPTQIIQPWFFGDNFSKSTCLWLKGLPALIPDVTEKPELDWFEWKDKKTGRTKRQQQYDVIYLSLPPEERKKERSKTFYGVAKAMAEQWGKEI